MSEIDHFEAPDMGTRRALRAFASGEFAEAVNELARCDGDDDPETQRRIADEMRAVASTTLGFGELLVRHGLARAGAPSAELGHELLLQIEAARVGREPSAPASDSSHTPRVEPLAPPDPGAGRHELEEFLAARLAPTATLLRAPFGAMQRDLRLVERDHRGYDIWWWSGSFFAVVHGGSPFFSLQLVRLLQLVRTGIFALRRLGRRLAPHFSPTMRRTLRRVLLRSAARRVATGDLSGSVRVPLVRLRVARTGLEMHQLIERSKRWS